MGSLLAKDGAWEGNNDGFLVWATEGVEKEFGKEIIGDFEPSITRLYYVRNGGNNLNVVEVLFLVKKQMK